MYVWFLQKLPTWYDFTFPPAIYEFVLFSPASNIITLFDFNNLRRFVLILLWYLFPFCDYYAVCLFMWLSIFFYKVSFQILCFYTSTHWIIEFGFCSLKNSHLSNIYITHIFSKLLTYLEIPIKVSFVEQKFLIHIDLICHFVFDGVCSFCLSKTIIFLCKIQRFSAMLSHRIF